MPHLADPVCWIPTVSAPPDIAAWLTQEGALSDALLLKGAQMTLIAQRCVANDWIREVLFHNTQGPLTYGRVVMPFSTYQYHQTALDALGNCPIGKTLLYANPTVTRSAFEFACLEKTDELFQQALLSCQRKLASSSNINPLDWMPAFAGMTKLLWARRSHFTWASHPLSITEVFFL